MLAKKYYAQYKNKGRYTTKNTNIVAPSTTNRLHRLKSSCCLPDVFKLPSNTSQSTYLKEKKAMVKKCDDNYNGNEICFNDCNLKCNVVKNMDNLEFGEYIEQKIFCPIDKELQKPVMINRC